MLFADKGTKIERYAKKRNSAKLVALLTDKKQDIRVLAIKALGTIGDEAAVNSLIDLLGDPDPAIRLATVQSMGVMENQVTKTHLQHLNETETDESVKAAIRETILKIPNKK
ncbi:MAG: HEAT repeat domain-containing protein [Clostridiaceae bacterium]|nr:HEAT repeat domain-containing protein [Clostridiaceae bacterium]